MTDTPTELETAKREFHEWANRLMAPDPLPPDPWRELRKAAEAESKAQELYGGRGNELGKHVATILALLAERDRLAEALARWEVVHD